jgi:hypothetical protein
MSSSKELVRKIALEMVLPFKGIIWKHLKWCYLKKTNYQVWSWWLTSIILATSSQEAEIRRIVVQSQPWANSSKTLSRKYPIQKRSWLKR